MTVRDTMKTELIVATPEMELSEVARLLIKYKITGLPVVDPENMIIGVISEADLLRTVGEPHIQWKTVSQLMTPNPMTVNVNEPLHTAFDILMTHSFRRVLIEDNGKLAGLISRTDLLPAILDELTDPS